MIYKLAATPMCKCRLNLPRAVMCTALLYSVVLVSQHLVLALCLCLGKFTSGMLFWKLLCISENIFMHFCQDKPHHILKLFNIDMDNVNYMFIFLCHRAAPFRAFLIGGCGKIDSYFFCWAKRFLLSKKTCNIFIHV